ncbi:MAG: sugar phosphate isomerase/epimerase [Kiritimatiellae bacterium]|nr:sugar phosphate isomerase/epimerase [Kiritimatiellia bacterium]
MQLAICQWRPVLYEAALEALRAQGVTALEPGPSLLWNNDDAALERLRAHMEQAGIRLYSCHAPFSGPNDLSLLDNDARLSAVDVHVETIHRAVLAGVECLVIHPGLDVTEPEREARLEKLMASLELLLPVAEQMGMPLALENMPPGYLGDESWMIGDVMANFPSLFLGVCFDTGHAHMTAEGVTGTFRALRTRIITFHIHDNDGSADAHLQPPHGTIDWPSFARELHTLNFPFPLAVEAEPWNGASWSQQLQDVAHLLSAGE